MIETGGMTKEEYQAKVKDFVCRRQNICSKMKKNGKIAEIFQYAYYADTKRLLFTSTDRRKAKWINKDHYLNSSVWKIIFTFHTFLSVFEKYWRDRRPYYKDCT